MKQFENGVSQFKYSILNDIVTMDVNIEWDEYGEATIDEITVDGYDLTEEILSFGLEETLKDYAIHNGIFSGE